MNVLVLNAHSPKNAGDLAILQQVVATLRAAYPGAQLTVTMNDPDREGLPSGVRYVDLFMRWVVRIDEQGEWIWRKWLVPLYACVLLAAAVLFRLAGLRWLPRNPLRRGALEALYDADVVIVFGGGHLYARRRFNIAFAWLWLGLSLAPLMGKPLVFLPQSFGPLPSRLQQAMLRWLLRRSAFVAARELHSLSLLAAIGVRRPVLLLPDMAFSEAGAEVSTSLPGRPGASTSLPDRPGGPTALTGRPETGMRAPLPELDALLATGDALVGLTLMDWQTQNPGFVNQARYEDAVLALLRHVAARGARVAIFAQCTGPTAGQDDRIIARRVAARAYAEQLPVVFVDRALGPEQLRDAYARLDALVATRMHSAIFALGNGVPCLAIGYLHKSIGIMELLGLQRYVLAIDTLDTPALLARFDELWDRRSEVRRRLAERIPAVRHTLERLPGLLRVYGPHLTPHPSPSPTRGEGSLRLRGSSPSPAAGRGSRG